MLVTCVDNDTARAGRQRNMHAALCHHYDVVWSSDSISNVGHFSVGLQ